MASWSELDENRALLFSTSVRFLPEFQPLKQMALGIMVEQVLYINDDSDGLSAINIQQLLSDPDSRVRIPMRDIRDALRILYAKQRVESIGDKNAYCLSKKVTDEIDSQFKMANAQFDQVIVRLFSHTKEGAETYKSPFLRLLGEVFADLGEESARLIKGDAGFKALVTPGLLEQLIDELIQSETSRIDPDNLRIGIIDFFEQDDPVFNEIKWAMSQNYFVVKALGLDSSGMLLSDKVFRDATFCLDTNIAVCALESTHEHYNSFVTFAEVCKNLGIKLAISKITLDELNAWIAYQKELMYKIVDEIPEAIESEVSSLFFDKYKLKKAEGEVELDELFESFHNPKDTLEQKFGVSIINDHWFDNIFNNDTVRIAAEQLIFRYKELRNKSKRKQAALHDAAMLVWIKSQRENENTNTWLLTIDTSLPSSIPAQLGRRQLAVTLDAVVQWMAPVVRRIEKREFKKFFSQMIRHRLLPQKRFMNPTDFVIFHEMHIS